MTREKGRKMQRKQRARLGEKVIYLAILSFDKYPKRDVRTLTAAEKERYQAFECKMVNAPLVGRVV